MNTRHSLATEVETPVQNVKLIDGHFSPEDARKILYALIKSKIKFHDWESFSNEERFGIDPSHSQKRVEELKEACHKVKEITDYAQEHGLKFKINSMIHIELT